MRVTRTDFEARVRTRAGSPSTADVSAATITESVDSALREYSKYRGPQSLEVMLTVENQQEYVLPDRFAMIEDVVWGEDVDVRGDIFRAESFAPFDALAGLDTFQSPSLLNIVYQQLEDFRCQFEGTWQIFDAPTGGALCLRIAPPPYTAQRMLVIGKSASALENVPEKDVELLMDGCLWKLNEMRVGSMAGVDSASFGGGTVSFGTKNFTDAAVKFEERFRAAIGGNSPIFGRG